MESSASISLSSSPSSSTISFPIRHIEDKLRNKGHVKTGILSANDGVPPTPNLLDYDWNNLNITGYEWISSELRDDALLSAVTLQGHHLGHTQPQEISLEEKLNVVSGEEQVNAKEHGCAVENDNPGSSTLPNKVASANDKLYQQNLN